MLAAADSMKLAPLTLAISLASTCAIAQLPRDTARPVYDGSDPPNAPRRIRLSLSALSGENPPLEQNRCVNYS